MTEQSSRLMKMTNEVRCQRKSLQNKSDEANGRRLLVVLMPYITVRKMTLRKCLVLFVGNNADHAFSLSPPDDSGEKWKKNDES